MSMRGRIGTHMKYKGFIIPRTGMFDRVRRNDISKGGEKRLKWMDFYRKVGNARLTCRYFGISPDTFYRWKRRYDPKNLKSLEDSPKSRRPNHLRHPETEDEIVNRIRELREKYPRWGKEKIRVLLKREGILVSSSTVGRTISRLKSLGYLKEPIPNFISSKKRYLKRAWAVRKPSTHQASIPGDLIEIDTMDIRPIPGVVRKQFTARDIVSRWDVLEVYGSATSGHATKFLSTLKSRLPSPIKAIQIDGGSEFKGEFEIACKEQGINLFVLPPRSPKLNGHVERSNRTHAEEFYEVNDFSFDLDTLNQELRDWEETYNTVRPHQSLNYLTPLEYINQCSSILISSS